MASNATAATTPLFSIAQNHASLTLTIRAPHSRPHDIEVVADGIDFTFLCLPYALCLRFDHPVYLHEPIDAPPTHTTYDFTTGLAHVTLRKSNPGTHFENLDLLATLIHGSAPPADSTLRQPFAAPGIQVISSTPNLKGSHVEPQPDDEALQSLPTTNTITRSLTSLNDEFAKVANVSGLDIPLRELALTRPTYGFGGRYEAVFNVRREDASQIVQLPDPDSTPVWRRPALRKAAEDAKFDPDHYIADYLLEHEYNHVYEYCPRPRDTVVEALDQLPKREYLPDVNETAAADLAGILFASAYDERITAGERNVETPWTVSRLSPSLAFLEQMKTPREAILAAYRRSLAYPLYRSVNLANRVLQDVKEIFGRDVAKVRAVLLNILMELRQLFESDQLLRLLCDLYLIDYCVWIQSVDSSVLERLGDQVGDIDIERHELEWNLDAIEQRAERMAKGEEVEDEVPAVAENVGGHPEADLEEERPSNEVVITARSPVARPGMECVPLRSTLLKSDVKYGPPEVSSTSSEYDSDSSTCSTSSSE